jgi:hypothetical protein
MHDVVTKDGKFRREKRVGPQCGAKYEQESESKGIAHPAHSRPLHPLHPSTVPLFNFFTPSHPILYAVIQGNPFVQEVYVRGLDRSNLED